MSDVDGPDPQFAERLWARMELEAFGPQRVAVTARLPRRRPTFLLAAAAAVTALAMLVASSLQTSPRAIERLEVADVEPSPDPRPEVSAAALAPEGPRASEAPAGAASAVGAPQPGAAASALAPLRLPVALPRPQEVRRRPGASEVRTARGDQVLFGARGSGDGDDLFLMDLESEDITPVYTSPYHEFGGDFSPDGESLAFSSSGRPEHGKAQIYVTDMQGNARRITHAACAQGGTSYCSDRFPSWSPAGNVIAFERGGPSGCEETDEDCNSLMLVRPDGSGLRRLASGWSPDWSPDGRQLVFMLNTAVDREGCYLFATCAGTLHVINADGTGLRSLGVRGLLPKWSPDGRQIAYTAVVARELRVRLIRPDGTGDHAILPEGHNLPTWSPDGETLLTLNYQGNQLWLSNRDGTNLRELDATAGYKVMPVFRPR